MIKTKDYNAQGHGAGEATRVVARLPMDPPGGANDAQNGNHIRTEDRPPQAPGGERRRGRSRGPRSGENKEGPSYDNYGSHQGSENDKDNARPVVRARSERRVPMTASCDPVQVPSSEPTGSRPPHKTTEQAKPPVQKFEVGRNGGATELGAGRCHGLDFRCSLQVPPP